MPEAIAANLNSLDPGLNLLIAEDDLNLRSFLVAYFKKRGIKNVFEATTGTEALDICMQVTINYIISDWNMPEMTGEQFLEAIRTLENASYYNRVPFIMLTSLKSEETVIKAKEARVDDYLVKPFKLSLLEERFEKLLLSKLPDKFIELAFIDITKNCFESAGKKLSMAYPHNSDEPSLLCGLAICNIETCDTGRASNYLNAVKRKENDPFYLYTRGIFNAAKGSHMAAIKNLLSCIEIEPLFVKAYIHLAKIHLELNDPESALEIIKKIDISEVAWSGDRKEIQKIGNSIGYNPSIQ